MIISEPIIPFIMRTALAYKHEDDDDEVLPVVSIEVLESNVTAMRGELTELKTDFKEHRKEFVAAVVRLDNDIKTAVLRLDSRIESAVSELRAEIRSMTAKAENDLKDFAGRIEHQLREMHADHVELRDKSEKRYETLNGKIDWVNVTLSGKIDMVSETLGAKIDANNEKLTELTSKVNALFWVIGVAVAASVFFITVGNALHWF